MIETPEAAPEVKTVESEAWNIRARMQDGTSQLWHALKSEHSHEEAYALVRNMPGVVSVVVRVK